MENGIEGEIPRWYFWNPLLGLVNVFSKMLLRPGRFRLFDPAMSIAVVVVYVCANVANPAAVTIALLVLSLSILCLRGFMWVDIGISG